LSRDELYLRHVLEAIEKIETYSQVGFDEFKAASQWQDAIIRQLEIVGEAVKRVSPNVLSLRPEVPWRRVAGMRDVLIHNYMGVDLNAVWKVTQQDILPLKEAIQDLLNRPA